MTRFVRVLMTLMPSRDPYKMKLPDSSKMMFTLRWVDWPSTSRSVAILRPNSVSSSFASAVPACCMAVIVSRDSSYDRYILPVLKSNTRILRSGNEYVANCCPEGDMVIHDGADLAFFKSNKLVEDFILKTVSGFSKLSRGVQYSIMPDSSAETTQSYTGL